MADSLLVTMNGGCALRRSAEVTLSKVNRTFV